MDKVKQCWWCQETFEEGSEIHLYQSGWLCNKCKSYLEMVGLGFGFGLGTGLGQKYINNNGSWEKEKDNG